MDKFDLQIAMLKPANNPARLNEKQFTKKLAHVRRADRTQRLLIVLLSIAALAVAGGALRRGILDVCALTFNYFGELPSMLQEYLNAYTATISWPSVASLALIVALGISLGRMRRNMATYGKRTYQYATAVGVLALGLGVAGLINNSAHANAQQDALRRALNERGHLEIQVGDKDYELFGQSDASDNSIRYQAFIEELRTFDISQAYPDLKDMNRDGFVVEVRAINTQDDCVFYVERRLEPALNQVIDANSGCIKADTHTAYLNSNKKPAKAPKWKVGQALYLTSAHKKGAPANKPSGFMGIVVILEGQADQYVARSNAEKIVPKGQPGTGVQSCGIDRTETCPQFGSIDVFTNAVGQLASGEIGSSVPGDSLKPRPDTSGVNIFGEITAMDNERLQIKMLSGQKLVLAWPKNIIEEFNSTGAKYYPTASGPLRIQTGDHLELMIYYKAGMDLEKLSISDVMRINLAIKTTLPDALENEKYSKDKAGLIEKY